MGKKKPPKMESPTAPGWMATYGDLMSLLLVFFILLVSFSTMEIVKFRKAMGSMKGGVGFLEPDAGTAAVESMPIESEAFEEALDELIEQLEESAMADKLNVYWDTEGVRIVMQDAILFNPGRSEIKAQFYPILDGVIQIIRSMDVAEVQVEGYTDDVPINTIRFPSNWELSVARATSVLRYIEASEVLEARKLAAVGYGEFRPDVPNDSVENRGRNRRVEIYILKQK